MGCAWMDDFQIITIASSVLDGLIAVACAVFAARIATEASHLNVPRLLLAALLAGVVLLLKGIAVLEIADVNFFGLFRLIYIDLVIVGPITAALLLFFDMAVRLRQRRAWMTWPVQTAALMIVILATLIGVYSCFIEPARLQLEKTTLNVSNRSSLNGPIRIGVIADFQTDRVGPHERRAIDLLLSERPDVIVFPGDVFQGTEAQFEQTLPALRELFGRLNPPGGVFVIQGNCDTRRSLDAMFGGLENVRVLWNETASTTVRGNKLLIGGLGDNDFGDKAQAVVRELELAGESAAARVLLAHRPDAVELMSKPSNIELLIAGHTHGGQVCMPFFGPLITLTNVPRAVAAGGLHEIDGRRIYVSRGVGHERGQAPRIRFLCPPEVSVITIESSKQ